VLKIAMVMKLRLEFASELGCSALYLRDYDRVMNKGDISQEGENTDWDLHPELIRVGV
jgi:hypothetical protein